MMRSLWRRVTSFRRPDGPALDEVPEVGSVAPERPRVGSGRPRVVLFLRHIGCAFGESMLKDLREASREHPEMEFVAVTHGDPEAATNWCRQLGIGTVEIERVTGEPTSVEWCQDIEHADVRVFVDPEREVYAEWGLGLGGANHLLDPRVLWSVAKVHLGGSRDRVSSGSRWQRAGMFTVDADGFVRAVHTADYAGDMPDIEVATTFLAGSSNTAAAEAVLDEFERGWVVGETDAEAREATEETAEVTVDEPSEADESARPVPAGHADLTPAVVRVDHETEVASEPDAEERPRIRMGGED